jgi:uncharacterized membrane protein HdeD (DUF308 family)
METEARLRPSILYFRALAALLFGAFCLLVTPESGLRSLILAAAAFLGADGAAALFLRQQEADKPERSAWPLLTGILGILAGALVFLTPYPSLVTVGSFFGAWAALVGIFQVGGIQGKEPSLSRSARIVCAIGGGATTLFGVLILLQPWLSAERLLNFLSLCCGVSALVFLYLGLSINRFQREQDGLKIKEFRRSA